MTPRSWIRKIFVHPVTSPIRNAPRRVRLALEALEIRDVPATFTVLNSNDSGAGSLRDAVAQADTNPGADTIVFGDGSGSGGTNFLDATPDTILLTSATPITFNAAALTTVTGTGAALLTVDGNNTSSVFTINSGRFAALSGLTIAGGNAANGGGVDNLGTVTLTNSTITNNTASTNGAGVFSSGTVTLTDCTLTSNTAGTSGGGVFSSGGATLTNCTITGNIATSTKGGGVYAPSGTITLDGVTLSSNHAGYRGGGFGNQNATADLTNCTITGNTLNNGSASGGAGVFNRNTTTTLTNCTITGNSSPGGFQAGGVFNVAGTVALTDCTVSGNFGVNSSTGTGIFNQAATAMTFLNTIVAGNASTDVNGPITSLGNNLISRVGTTTGWVGSDLTGTNAAPLNPQLAALADNGGPTQTMALLPNSPAINAGNFAGAPTTDQRGLPRFGNTDIGAYEYQFKVTNTTDNTSPGSLRTAITNADSSPGTDTIVFKIGTGAQTISPTSALPTISETVVIDGTTQTGYVATPLIQIDGASAGNVDGLTLGSGSSGSTLKGLIVSNFSASGHVGISLVSGNNIIQGNWIGLDSTGTAAAANYTGIGLSSGNLIGTNGDGVNDAAERNVIGGNLFDGVVSNGGNNNRIAGNYIGTNAAGNASLDNSFANVFISSADGNIIGTDGSNDSFNANERNVINGGILVSRNTVIAGNYIGLNAAGTAALSGASVGIQFGNTTPGARIGTNADGIADAAERNVIGVLNGPGILTSGSSLVIAGNYIGTNAAGTSAVPNQQGIELTSSASGIRIGTNADGVNDAAEGNLISGNTLAGVQIDTTSNNNVVAGNTIGLNAAGTAALGNGTGVVVLGGSSNNTIGGTTAGAANTIAFNTAAGVSVTGASTGNAIRANSIYSNGGLGIDLGGDGVTTNDASGHTGPNDYQNFPVLTFVGGGSSTAPRGILTASPNSTYTIDFYASATPDASGYGEGQRYLGAATVTTNAVGQAPVSVILAGKATTTNEVVSATATDANGNTSEFSQSLLTDVLPTVTLSTPTQALVGVTLPFTPTLTDTVPGKTYQYAWAVTFNGAPIALPNAAYVSDGATDQETFFFTPQRVGTYVVSVTVTDNRGGATTAASNPMQVNATTLGVTITGNPLGTPVPFAVVSGQSITLTSRIADPRQALVDPKTGATFTPNYTYAWSVTRDGLPFTLPTSTVTTAPTWTFTPTTSGLYVVSLAVSDGTQAAGAESVSMYNTAAPSAQVIVTPGTAVTAGTLVNVQAIVTDVALRRSLTYSWTITPDNGQSVITGTNSTGVFAFPASVAGNYVVVVSITDDQNRTGTSAPVQIRVSRAAPTVTISGAPRTVVPGAAVTLTGLATDADPNQPGSGSTNVYTLSWKATNTAGTIAPATGTGSTYTFTPSAAGTVIVTLTATDQNGVMTSVPVVINVAPPPAALTVTPPANPTQGQSLTWTAARAPATPGTTYSWSVFSPDGVTRTYDTGTNNALTLTSALPGRYDVTVTATANGFQYATRAPAPGTFVIVPHAPVALTIAVSPPVVPQTSLREGDTVTLTGLATEPGVDLTNLAKASYLWTVTGPNGFSQVGVLPTLNLVPLVAGTYTATLTVRDFTGGSATATATFGVTHVPPQPILKYVSTATDGTVSFRAVVSNPSGFYSYTYAVQLNGSTYILPAAGGSTFAFSIPPVTAPTQVSVTVTDSGSATGQIAATIQPVAAGTPTAPVQKTITTADLLPGTNTVVALALGFDTITADPSLPDTSTVEFIAVGGHNKFFGGPGTNIFQGDSGTNAMTGGSGPNTFFASGNDTLTGGAGTNLYVPVTVDTSTGNVLNVAAGTGANTFDLSQQNAVSLDLTATGSAQPFDSIGNQVMLTGNFQSVLGSAGADTLTAASGANISGGGGNDLLKSNGANNVTLSAGSGLATLQATGGSGVLLMGGKDTNVLNVTGVQNASLVGGSGNNDSLIAGPGSLNVSLVGGSGSNDSLVALGGNVSLIGGSGGNDSLVAGAGSLNVSLIGGSGGNDSLIALGGIPGTPGAMNVSLIGGSGGNDSLVAGAGSLNVSLVGGSGGNDSLVALGGNVSLIGGSGSNDTLVAGIGSVNVSLVGSSGGNDSLVALGGNVSLIGGSGGNDSLVAGGGSVNVSLIGGSGGNDSLVAGAGSVNVSLVGGSGGNDSLIAAGGIPGTPGAMNVSLIGGSGGNDSLIALGGTVNVSLVGGSGGNDSLVAGAGSLNVSLIGGSGGNDSLIALGGNVSLIGGSGSNDTLVAGAGSFNVSLIGGSGGNDSLVALGGNVTLIGGSGGNDSLVAGAGSVNVSLVGGSGGNDSLVALGGNVSLIGGSGSNDTLVVGAGAVNVSLVGGSGGHDSLVALGGTNVSLIGGSGGNDTLIAGAGAGTVNVSLVGGSGGHDSLVALGGTNVSLIGGSGSNDTLIAGAGTVGVSLVGGSGSNDSLVAGAGSLNVSLVGGSGGNDSLVALGGNVSLIGSSGGNDSLVAGPGSINVTLVGGSGNNDSLVATGATNVSLIGGSGDGMRLSVVDTAGAILLGGLGRNLSLSASTSAHGTSSNVVLIGGFGDNDSLTAGAGVNGAELVGGFGSNDYIQATGVNNAVLVGGFGDNDSLIASGGDNVVLLAGFGNNALLSRVGGTNSYLVGQSGNNDSLVSVGGVNVSLIGGSGNDLYVFDRGSQNVSLLGGSGNNDTVVSVNGTNVTVFGGNGNNNLVSASRETSAAGGTNVFAIGGTGNNNRIVATNLSNSTLFGGAGNSNTISTTNGTNVLAVGGLGFGNVLMDTNGSGDTLANGGNQLSSLVASGGNSVRLFGGGGTDALSATGGTNIALFGENGDNTYTISGTAANPFSGYLDDLGTVGLDQSTTDQAESGTNTIVLQSADRVTIDLSLAVGGAVSASSASAATQQVATGVSLYLIGLFEGVVGSATGNDFIRGNAVANSLVAGSGNTTLVAGSGNTTLVAGSGTDSLVGGSGQTTYTFRTASGSATITQANANNMDVVDLSALSGPATLNLASTTTQVVNAGLKLTLTNPTLSDVIGSPGGNTLTGNSRDNHFTLGTGNNTVTTGSGLTTLKYTGSALGTNTITASAPQSVVLNFHQLGAPVSIDLSRATQTVASGTVSFAGATGARAVASVVGTIYGDVLTGNPAPGAPGVSLYGGGGRDSLAGGAGDDFLQAGVPQVVLLDFDTYTALSAGNHVYTQFERDTIQQRMQGVYSAFASSALDGTTAYDNGFVFTQSLATARALTRSTGGEFVTMYFNKPPVGGQADEVDFANADLGGTASVDASLILGAVGQPAPTSTNFIDETAGLAEHELAHLSGLRHTDSFGPIGTGGYEVFVNGVQVSGLDPNLFYPIFQQPATAQAVTASASTDTSLPVGATVYADETPLHVMGSPASVGISRYDTLGNLYFGEREAIRMAFDQSGVILKAQTAAHGSAATAQELGALPGLVVPNALGAGALDAGKSFDVSAVAVVGSIGLDSSGKSRSDWYSFTGHAGDMMSFETISNVLPGNAHPLDTILRVYDAAGNLLAMNDDELESRDSLIIDFQIPADGKYYVQVDTYAQNPAANASQGNYVLYMTSFKIGPSSGGGSTLVAGSGHDVLYGGQGNNLFRLAPSATGSVTVIGGNGADVLDQTPAPLESVTVIAQPGNSSITRILGKPPVNPTFSTFSGIVGVNLTNQLVASFTDPSGADTAASYSATIDWGDGTAPTTGTIGAAVNGIFPVTGTHTYTASGAFTVTVTIVHGTSPAATASGSVSVSYGQVAATGGITAAFAGGLASTPVVAKFTDPNGAGAIALYSATINWGDGISSTGTISGPVNGVFSVSGTHTYFDLGSVPISVLIARGTAAPMTVTSTANVGTSIFALNPTLSGAVTLSGAPTISIGGALVIDSSSSTALSASGSPHITAGSIRIVGGYSASGAPQITPTPITHGSIIADPLAGLPVPANPGNTPINASIGGSTVVTLNPGRYSQINISGAAKVTLNPGIYVIAAGGLTVAGSATLTGNGVLIYVAGSNYPNNGGTYGGISFSGAAVVSLKPASTGTYAGVTIFQARDNNRAITFSGSAQTGVNGFVYAPNALLTLSGAITDLHMGLIVDRLNTSGSASSGLGSDGTGTEDGAPAGELLSTNLFVYVSNPLGQFNSAELDRIQDAITNIDALLAPYGVDVTEVSDPDAANVIIDLASTSVLGGMSDGVLAVYDPTHSEVTLIDGWNWYDGSDPSAIGASQFDFQTVVTHELGHALGLGHNPDAASTMHATLSPDLAKRSLTALDLNIGDEDNLPGALHADLSGLIPVGRSTPVAEDQLPQQSEPSAAPVPSGARTVPARAAVQQIVLVDQGARVAEGLVPVVGPSERTTAFAPVIDRVPSGLTASFGPNEQPPEGSGEKVSTVTEAKRPTVAPSSLPAATGNQEARALSAPRHETDAEALLVAPAGQPLVVEGINPSWTAPGAEEESAGWTELVLLALVTGCAVAALDRPEEVPPPEMWRVRLS